MEGVYNKFKWWKHWSVSGSIVIAAISLCRDFSREMGRVQNGVLYWYLAESLIMILTVLMVARRFTGDIFANVEFPEDWVESNVDQTVHEHLATQTNDEDYKRSVEKLKSYQHAKINKVNRDIRQLRKHFSEKITKLKSSTNEVKKVMSAIQLKIPSITEENKFLTEQRDALNQQIVEETTKQQDLHEKYLTLHSYMYSYGREALTEPIPDVVQ